MAEKIDTASMVKQSKLFIQINELDEKLYKTIEEKGLEIKSLVDVERVERFFNPILKELIKVIEKNPQQTPQLTSIVKNRVIIDFHGRFAEKYKLDMMQVVEKLGKYNVKLFSDALSGLKGIM